MKRAPSSATVLAARGRHSIGTRSGSCNHAQPASRNSRRCAAAASTTSLSRKAVRERACVRGSRSTTRTAPSRVPRGPPVSATTRCTPRAFPALFDQGVVRFAFDLSSAAPAWIEFLGVDGHHRHWRTTGRVTMCAPSEDARRAYSRMSGGRGDLAARRCAARAIGCASDLTVGAGRAVRRGNSAPGRGDRSWPCCS